MWAAWILIVWHLIFMIVMQWKRFQLNENGKIVFDKVMGFEDRQKNDNKYFSWIWIHFYVKIL